MKRLMLYTLTCLLALAVPAFAYVGDAYVTPDSWSKHVNANGIKASLNGLDFGDSGILKIGLTTRATMKFGEDEDWSIYQYARLRLSDAKLGQGTVNVRTAYQQASREAVIISFMTVYIHQENMMNIPA